MASSTILVLLAHPDDETFGAGGTLATYAEQGARIVLVCATRGEAGEISDPALASPTTLPDVREAELRCAARTLGISELHFLGYRDSGMTGSAENEDPRAFINIPPELVVRQLVEIIRREQPQVILTFDPTGGYGHPDHIAIHHHAVAAFHNAADPAYECAGLSPWRSKRLFYLVVTHEEIEEIGQQLDALGVDTELFRLFAEQGMGWQAAQVHLSLDVSSKAEVKWAAMHCHQTQFGLDHPFRQLPDAQRLAMVQREHFVLAWPPAAPSLKLQGFFDSLTEE